MPARRNVRVNFRSQPLDRVGTIGILFRAASLHILVLNGTGSRVFLHCSIFFDDCPVLEIVVLRNDRLVTVGFGERNVDVFEFADVVLFERVYKDWPHLCDWRGRWD